MRIGKGERGYIRDQKRRRLVRTAVLFAIAFGIFAVGMVLNGGERRNIYSIVAAVGCIPAAMSAVGMIMIWMRHPISDECYREVSGRAGGLRMLYELYLTTSDTNLFLDAAAVRGYTIAAYSSEARSLEQTDAIEKHIQRVMRQQVGVTGVCIYTDLRQFLEHLDELAASETEQPEAEDAVAYTLLALSL